MPPIINLPLAAHTRSTSTRVSSRSAIHSTPDEIETDGEFVAEVIASHGSTVLDAQHVGQVHGRRRRAHGWLALGGLMLLAGAGVVAGEVGQDWDGYQAARADATTKGQPIPEAPGHGFGGLGFGLALLGLVPFGLGVVRRNDVGLDHYTLGETPDANFPVSADALPEGADSFALIERHGDRYALAFTPRMRGEVHWSGHTCELETLVARGHTIPTASGHKFVLPDGARCRLEHEGITYRIGTVARGKVVARGHDPDKPFWLYNAGSFAVMGTLLALVHLVPEDALAMSMDETMTENRYVGYMQQPDLETEPDVPVVDGDLPEEASTDGTAGQAAAGPSGAIGSPKSTRATGRTKLSASVRGNPMLARGYDPAVVSRDAGILGVMDQFSGNILASPTGAAYSMGSDDGDVWAGVGDGDGMQHGFGTGLVGTGRQGGGDGDGTVGFGTAGLMGKQGAGQGDRYGKPGTGHGGRRPKVPKVKRGKDDIVGPVDKDAIRRVVRSHINQVRHCYNQGLTRDPNMRGRVAVKFAIGPTGRVLSSIVSENGVGDRDVGTCVANAVRRWKFPAPHGGGSAMVTYPFSFVPG